MRVRALRPAIVPQARVLDAAEVSAIERAGLVAEAKRLRRAIDGAAGLAGAGARPSAEDLRAMLADCARVIDGFLEHEDRRPIGPRKARSR